MWSVAYSEVTFTMVYERAESSKANRSGIQYSLYNKQDENKQPQLRGELQGRKESGRILQDMLNDPTGSTAAGEARV